jgi:NitT/TauT family transport system substrate-binding protein
MARPLFNSKDAVGISEFTMWTARRDFIAKNRAALVDFMEDALTILRWYLDPANHEAAVDIFARVTKQPRERLGWAYTGKDYFRDPNLKPDLAALQRNVDLTRDLGFIKASIDVAKSSDLSLVQEAAKRVK